MHHLQRNICGLYFPSPLNCNRKENYSLATNVHETGSVDCLEWTVGILLAKYIFLT